MSNELDPVVSLPLSYVSGLVTSVASNTTLSVSSGSCWDSTNTFGMTLLSATTLNAAVNGANGLDTGSFAASKIYAVHLIFDAANSNPTATLLSLSATTPTLPAGYGYFRRIGWAFSDSSTHFISIRQSGREAVRDYFYNSAISVLSAGAATSLTAISLENVVPAIDMVPVLLNVSLTPSAAGRSVSLVPSGTTGTNKTVITGPVSTVIETAQVVVPALLISSIPKIDYIVSNASDAATIYVQGFRDYL